MTNHNIKSRLLQHAVKQLNKIGIKQDTQMTPERFKELSQSYLNTITAYGEEYKQRFEAEGVYNISSELAKLRSRAQSMQHFFQRRHRIMDNLLKNKDKNPELKKVWDEYVLTKYPNINFEEERDHCLVAEEAWVKFTDNIQALIDMYDPHEMY